MVQPPSLLGRRLKPFSVVHRYALRTLGNPYAYRGIAGDPATLAAAVSVCCRDLAGIRKLLFSGKPWRSDRAFLRWQTFMGASKFAANDAAFRDYLRDMCATPEHNREATEGGGEPIMLNAPTEFHVVRVLMNHYHMTEAQAWNAPWSLAVCYCDCRGEVETGTKLLSIEQQHAYNLAEMALRLEATDPATSAKLYAESQAIFDALRADHA